MCYLKREKSTIQYRDLRACPFKFGHRLHYDYYSTILMKLIIARFVQQAIKYTIVLNAESLREIRMKDMKHNMYIHIIFQRLTPTMKSAHSKCLFSFAFLLQLLVSFKDINLVIVFVFNNKDQVNGHFTLSLKTTAKFEQIYQNTGFEQDLEVDEIKAYNSHIDLGVHEYIPY